MSPHDPASGHDVLQPWIRAIWEERRPALTHAFERVLPDGSVFLGLNLASEAVELRDPADPDVRWRFNRGFVCGPHSQPLLIQSNRPRWLLAVEFYPGAGYPFFGMPLVEHRNTSVSLESLWGRAAVELCDRLGELKDYSARRQCLEQVLSSRLSEASIDPFVRHTVSALGGLTAPRITTLVERSGQSASSLLRGFDQRVGLSPRALRRLSRFQRAVREIQGGVERSWCDLALGCGYYDQAHFIREFRCFSHLSPSRAKGAFSRCAGHVVEEEEDSNAVDDVFVQYGGR